MGIFDGLKQKKEVEQLKSAVRTTPSPNTYGALIKKYSEIGDEQNALEVAQISVNEFPASETLFEYYYRLRKSQAQNELENLKKVIEERPTAAAYAQIAEIYKDLRDEDSASKYCRDAIEKFPNDDSPYLIIGELRLRRFYKDPLIKDGKVAVQNLEKCCEINTRNYKALLLLAKFYLQIGAIGRAKQRLKNILLFAPEDEAVQKMLDTCSKVPPPSHEDIDILLQTVETQRELYYNLEEQKVYKTAAPPVPEVFNMPLEKLKTVKGLLCILICDVDGNLITQYAQEGIDLNTYYEVASTIYQTVQESSRQMDLGRCQKCDLEGGFGNIQLIVAEGVVYIAFTTPEQKQISKSLQRLISEVAVHTKH